MVERAGRRSFFFCIASFSRFLVHLTFSSRLFAFSFLSILLFGLEVYGFLIALSFLMNDGLSIAC